MESERPKLRSDALPKRLAEVFRLLQKGRHICIEDCTNYRMVEQEEDRYRTVFDALGYELIHHAQGFYYLKGGRTLSSRSLQSISIFVFLLFQHLEDNKQGERDHSWIRSLTAKRFLIDELPHFSTLQHRTMMAGLELTPITLRQRVLRVLNQLGMLEYIDENGFRFRSPIYRFVDLCMTYAEGQWDESPDERIEVAEHQIDAADEVKTCQNEPEATPGTSNGDPNNKVGETEI